MDEIIEDVIDGLTSTTAKDRKVRAFSDLTPERGCYCASAYARAPWSRRMQGEARKLLQHIDTEPLQLYLDRRAVSPGKSIRYASNEDDPSAPCVPSTSPHCSNQVYSD